MNGYLTGYEDVDWHDNGDDRRLVKADRWVDIMRAMRPHITAALEARASGGFWGNLLQDEEGHSYDARESLKRLCYIIDDFGTWVKRDKIISTLQALPEGRKMFRVAIQDAADKRQRAGSSARAAKAAQDEPENRREWWLD